MFELAILRKYLIPRKRELSAALIAFVSVAVISAVVWLLLLFLSVTEGIEKTWLKKLTSLHAPIRITPTLEYLNSYYYLADTISEKTGYTVRSLHEKLKSPGVDLYDATTDETPPPHWETPEKNKDGSLKDPLAIACSLIQKIKLDYPDLEYAPFEMSGGVLRLQLNRLTPDGRESHSFLTQASYLTSFPEESSAIQSLLLPPTPADLQQLLTQALKTRSLESFLKEVQIERVKTVPNVWHIPLELLPDRQPIPAKAVMTGGRILSVALGDSKHPVKGVLRKEGYRLWWNETPIQAPVVMMNPVELKASVIPTSISSAQKLSDLKVQVEDTVAGIKLSGIVQWKDFVISKATLPKNFTQPILLSKIQNKIVLPTLSSHERGIVLTKGFYDSGVRLGDRGWIQYQAVAAGSLQEQHLPVVVSGFYDPGVLTVGHKCILAPADVVHLIRTASPMEHIDKTASMGFAVWHTDLHKSKKLAEALQRQFDQANIARYWKITTYHDFEFSKDLIEQFQSDRYLFTFLGVIVLMVACSNIVSFLILLVQDKKREIGILQALGASKKSIAFIFGGCGAVIGLLSSFIGIGGALLTLRHLNAIIKFLSFLQGHPAFNATFYGSTLPSEMSVSAFLFVIIVTPLLSLIAGLIPAWKACRLSPSATLRSE